MTAINQPEMNSNNSAKIRRDRWSKFIYIILDNFVWVLVVLLLIIAFITVPNFFEPSNDTWSHESGHIWGVRLRQLEPEK